MLTNTEKLIIKMKTRLETATAAVERFKKSIDENGAAYALEWSHDAFQAGAMIRVFEPIVKHLEESSRKEDYVEEDTLQVLRNHVSKQLQHKAMYPSFSTSVPSNLVATLETKAYADVIELFDYNF